MKLVFIACFTLLLLTAPPVTAQEVPPCQEITPTIPPPVQNMYISEAQVHPSAGEMEWVELYNADDSAATLNGWQIDDMPGGGSSPKTFTLTIPAHGYGLYTLPTSMFNNDGDTVRLLDHLGIEYHRFEYEDSRADQTVGPVETGGITACFRTPTKGSANGPCILDPTPTLSPTPTLKPSLTPLPTPTIRPSPTGVPAARLTSSLSSVPPTKMPTLTTGAVLSSTDEASISGEVHPTPALPIMSFSYSLLSIVSVILKVRNPLQ